MRQSIFTLADVLIFGKYRGKTVKQVIDLNPGYILWMHDEGFVIDEGVCDAARMEDANQSPPEEHYWQPE